jgi:hypothetical protein
LLKGLQNRVFDNVAGVSAHANRIGENHDSLREL